MPDASALARAYPFDHPEKQFVQPTEPSTDTGWLAAVISFSERNCRTRGGNAKAAFRSRSLARKLNVKEADLSGQVTADRFT